ncbi:hypothetical protein EDB92DRAFT_1628117 [Lactarius akahatsu]|uniref:Uncharacterized protein n=1 Tax=Lactarius akahatsu TaxID=416441 RepID=A0AAD4L8L9_9AGAM|nr:hypothetical protein EDB92DRAFT_1628117 [Lactarius akahatsu]
MNSTRPIFKAYSPPVVPVGGAATATTAPAAAVRPSSINDGSRPNPIEQSRAPSSDQQSPLLPATSVQPWKKRAKRIVHLDADPANANAAGTWVSTGRLKRAFRLSHFGDALSARGAGLVTPAPEAPLAPLLLAEDSTTPKAPDVFQPKPWRWHWQILTVRRCQCWCARWQIARWTCPCRLVGRSAARRARAAASVFEAPGAVKDGVGEEIEEADAFRARVEALRSGMCDGLLKVFGQSHAGGSG